MNSTTENTTDTQRELLSTWIAALRSGNYIQASGGLTMIDAIPGGGFVPAGLQKRHCCVGVLSEILADRGALTRVVSPDRVGYLDPARNASSYEDENVWAEHQVAPYVARKALEDLIDLNGESLNWESLYTMNDTAGLTFDQIADHLQAVLDGAA